MSTTGSTLAFTVVNNIPASDTVYCYINGQTGANYDTWYMLMSDGETPYYIPQVSSANTPVSPDCAIVLGTSTTIQIPLTSGGRMFFSRNAKMTFTVNPGPALVMPSVSNSSDPNYNIDYGFVEFTLNGAIYINISCIDFVGLPLGIEVNGNTVLGMPSDGVVQMANKMTALGSPWADLVYTPSGSSSPLRVLGPIQQLAANGSSGLSTYFDSYVEQIWGGTATVSSQVATNGENLAMSNPGGTLAIGPYTFAKPTSADIFGCASGPFVPNSDPVFSALAAKLGAALNRGDVLTCASQPGQPSGFYQNPCANQWAKAVHELLEQCVAGPGNEYTRLGYAFPYDDVNESEDYPLNQSGTLRAAFNSSLTLTITVGGPITPTTPTSRSLARTGGHGSQLIGGRRAPAHARLIRRDLSDWASANEEKQAMAAAEMMQQPITIPPIVDLEKGSLFGADKSTARGPQLLLTAPRAGDTPPLSKSLTSLVPAGMQRVAMRLLERVEAMPAYARLRPALDVLVSCVAAFLSLSLRALVSRITMLVLLVLLYLLLPWAEKAGGLSPEGKEILGTLKQNI